MKIISKEDYILVIINKKNREITIGGQNPCVICNEFKKTCEGNKDDASSTCLVPCG